MIFFDHISTIGRKSFLIILISVVSLSLAGQTFNFKSFSIEEGLPDRFVYTIQSGPQGFLWIGTGAGLSRYDGKTFFSKFLPDSMSKSFVTAGYTDASGKVWFGFNDGYVIRFSGLGAPRFYNIRSISRSSINAFVEDPFGNILVASQNGGILRIKPGDDQEIENLNIDVTGITAVTTDTSGHLFLGTFDALYIYKFYNQTDAPALIEQINAFNGIHIQALLNDEKKGIVLAGTRGEGVFGIRPSDNQPAVVTNFSDIWKLPETNVQDIMRDSEGNIWLATFGNGVIKIEKREHSYKTVYYNEDNGLKSKNIKNIFEDFEHNIWFGTYGDGLMQLQSEAFQFITFPEPIPGNNVLSLVAGDDYLFAGTETGIIVRNLSDGTEQFISRKNGLPRDEIITLFRDNYGVLWIGTKANGVYRMPKPYNKPAPFFVSANDLERKINDINIFGKEIWVATSNGIFLLDYRSRVIRHYSTSDGLPYNKINQIYLDSDGTAWLATTSDALYSVSPDGEVNRSLVIPDMSARNEFLSIIRDHQGNMWAGTYGFGLFYFTPDTVLNYSTVSGLLSNYCYSLIQDRQGDIWVGHRSGISRLEIRNNFIRTYTSGDGVTGDANPDAAIIDQNGKLWFGTTSGIVTYDARHEPPDNIPPKTSILSVVISDQSYPVDRKLVLPYGKYRLRVDYIGISYSDPEAVKYQYILENYDEEWSDLTQNTFAYYSRLEDGRYTFRLKAYNAMGISNPEPVVMQVIIKKPFWKAWWFYFLVVIIVVSSVIMIIKIRERNHIRLQKYLQEELDKRTREVVAQKEELEIKNKEITDSINYAKRIQSSILPPVQRLKDAFSESFVFYQPRDIVSGDFYWWGRIDEDRFLVVCADSTGHGVPGAFMSMIGSTLIKDVTNQHRYESPSQLLSYLDKEITNALNQNLEAERSNDGMDIIICEIHPKTRHLKFASAMRPIILFHHNEQFYIRGNRSAVGGEVIGEKIFDDQEYDLNKGDIIYMFSDGYPDQFGGPRGKKFKMVRLKNLIDDIHDKPMDEQWLHIKTNFETWKGDYEQVDDVLFMGIRLL